MLRRFVWRRSPAFVLVACLGCADRPGTAETETEGGTEADGAEASTETDGGEEDPCGAPECPDANPCQDAECCPPGDPGCTPVFHDTQVVLAWSESSADCTNGCHGADPPAAGLSLLAENEPWCLLVDKPSSGSSPLNLVEPGEPLDSYLWHKLNGTHTCPDVGGAGSAMPPPPNSCPLAIEDPALFGLITEWICCGAPKSPEDPLGVQCF